MQRHCMHVHAWNLRHCCELEKGHDGYHQTRRDRGNFSILWQWMEDHTTVLILNCSSSEQIVWSFKSPEGAERLVTVWAKEAGVTVSRCSGCGSLAPALCVCEAFELVRGEA